MKQIYKTFFCFTLFLVAGSIGHKAFAHDIAVQNDDGVIIYYSIFPYNELCVTFRGKYSDTYSDEYSGDVVIPASVTYNGTNYRVKYICDGAFEDCSGLTSVTIPESVTSIGERAFYGCTGLTSVTIPEGVTSIGNNAFYRCFGLTSVTIPSSVTSIDEKAFYMSGLTSVTIPDNVTSIGSSAFGGCSHLERVTINSNTVVSEDRVYKTGFANIFGTKIKEYIIGEAVTKIGNFVFDGCSSLTNVIIPSSVKSIGEYAFRNCADLTNITIPGSIGERAFYGCSSLTGVTFLEGANNIYIDRYAFEGCSGLTTITIPSSVKSIGEKAFADCSGLTSVTINSNTIISTNRSSSSSNYFANRFGTLVSEYIIGESVTSIGSCAFNGLTGLTTISIPNSVTSIGSHAFYGCTSLINVTIPSSVMSVGYAAFDNTGILNNAPNGVFYVDNWVCGYKGEKPQNTITLMEGTRGISDKSFYDCSNITNITIPNSVTSIGMSAFQQCSSLTNVIIPNSVTSIGMSAFQQCSSLTNVIIPSKVTNISHHAFYGCTGLTKVNISEGVTSIGESAFNNCSNLSIIIVPSSMTNIGKDAFLGCSGLTKVIVPNFNVANWCNIKFNTSSDNPLFYAHHLYSDENTEIKELVIPDNVTNICDYAFYGCLNLSKVTIPQSIKNIGNEAFYGCSGLSSVYIPSSVTNISNYAFFNCSELSKVLIYSNAIISSSNYSLKNIFGEQVKEYVLGQNITSIGDGVFSGCTNLTKVNIPSKITSIGQEAFSRCSNLSSVTIPSNVNRIGLNAFDSPDTVTIYSDDIVSASTGHSYYGLAYHFGTGVKNYIIGEGVTSIGDEAFMHSGDLTSITIPSSMKNIGKNAFNGCSNLKKVITKDITSWCMIDFVSGSNDDFRSNPLYYAKHLYSDENTEITNLIIPSNVTTIKKGAFYGCIGLTSVIISPGVTSIASYAFRGCGIKSLTIPSSLKSISIKVFQCGRLTDVTNYSLEPQSIGEDTFSVYGTLHVLSGCKALYINQLGWKNFNIVEDAITDSIEPASSTATEVTVTGIFDTNGNEFPSTQPGINIIRYSDGTTKKVIMK